jgi:hypothetical protein
MKEANEGVEVDYECENVNISSERSQIKLT